ncbi:MAG: sigma-70 family RNA polymerase sigma factor [Thermoanaerobaculia bacterium]
MSPRELFEANLELIDRLLRSVCRRNAFPVDESEEFAGWARIRLIEDDYAVLRKFRGGSSLSTYLTVVIVNLFKSYRVHRWGRWRPSAEAKRAGAVAIQLETLTSRDGRPLDEAIQTLRTNFGCQASPEELRALAARLPPRVPRRLESEERLALVADPAATDARLAEAERRRTALVAERILGEAMAELPPEERLMLKLRFADGVTVADIAAGLGVPAKPLYVRFERCLGQLRRSLEARGLDAATVGSLVGWAGLDLRLDFRTGNGNAPASPSPPEERLA